MIHFARLEDCGRKILFVGRVRITLSFKAEACPELISNSVFSIRRSVKKIAGVELKSGLIGEECQDAPGSWLVDLCGLAQFFL